MTTKITRNITELDSFSIKENLKTFLKDQTQFTDYDFEGSALNIMMDMLTYTLHNTAYYANMLGNEMFIDSAQLRSSITSHCKPMGYTPKSVNASQAFIRIQLNPSTSVSNIVIPKDTKFSATVSGKVYYFLTTQSYVAKQTDNYIVDDVLIVEGKRYSYRYNVNTATSQQFLIPSKFVDIDYLIVTVQDSVNNPVITTWNKYDSSVELDGNSNVYFLHENKDGFYEIQFGDNVLGKSVSNGNIITLEYIITNNELANGCAVFNLVDSISGNSNVTITTKSKAVGGSPRETEQSIVHSAIHDFHTQRRAITANDYKAIIEKNYTNAESVKVWGGEDNIPPVYGKVFIAIKPRENITLTNSIKNYITSTLLKPYRVLSIIPEIVDPIYTNVLINSNVSFEVNTLPISQGALEANTALAIKSWANDNINKFDTIFRYSKLVSHIDKSNPSIISNETSIQLKNSLKVSPNTRLVYEIRFNNGFKEGSLSSTGFSLSNDGLIYYFEDDSNGALKLYRLVSNTKTYPLNSIAGTVDYDNGIIRISADLYTFMVFYSTVIIENVIQFTVTPKNNDIQSLRNQILMIETSDITVSSNGVM
jgi:hypothetical protein